MPHQQVFLHVSRKFQKVPSPFLLSSPLFLSCLSPNPINLKVKTLSHHNPTQRSHRIRASHKAHNMQSRLAYAARTSSWFLSSANRFTHKRGLSSTTRSQTADPEIHSGELEAGPDVHRKPPQGTKNNPTGAKFAETDRIPGKDNPIVSSKSPVEPSPKLKSTGVNQRLDPNVQQKRKQGSKALEEVSCAGLDGSPWPKDTDKEEERIREEQREDNRDYFKHHKASPLSELEFADTRKPVSRVSDGTADSEIRSGDVIGWLPEQLDTAEDSLRRATEIWRHNAMRGDPDAPHSRVLRALRGEDF